MSHRNLWRTIGGALVALLLIGGAAGWVLSSARPAMDPDRESALFERPGDANRGKLVFHAADCSSCHVSPGQSDPERLGGGLALASPFGTLYPPNISPDPEDGIGRWRTRDMANALLSGVSPTQQHYYPAFPYTSFTRMRAEDVRDLMAYLRTLPPVKGRTPPHDLPFPLTIRRLVGLWKLIYFREGEIPLDPNHDDVWNRGRYLVEGPAHCAECHSARDLFGGIKQASRLAGGQDPEQVGYVPNITPAAIGRWSRAEMITALTTGETPELRTLGSTMASVVENTAALPASDREAIAAYILSVPPRHSPNAVKLR